MTEPTALLPWTTIAEFESLDAAAQRATLVDGMTKTFDHVAALFPDATDAENVSRVALAVAVEDLRSQGPDGPRGHGALLALARLAGFVIDLIAGDDEDRAHDARVVLSQTLATRFAEANGL